MRDLILIAALAPVLPLVFRAPFLGLLAWIWITLMNPQREVYGFLSGFQLNLWLTLLTAAAWLASKERKSPPLNPLMIGFLLFGIWCCVTTAAALAQAHAMVICDRTVKSLILAFAVAILANTRARIQAVLWMVVISIDYYALKGGGFVLLTGGHSRVYGPADTMIADNNQLGLALIVLLPVLGYLHATSRAAITRTATLVTMGAALLAILGTYSRGALVALAACAAVYAVRSRYGVLALILAALLAGFVPSFLPSSWVERMSTLQSANQDESFAGRVAAWRTSTNIALARPLVGGGFAAVEDSNVVRQYESSGSLRFGKAAHSIYFEVLGDHGFVGLTLYLFVLASAGLNTFVVLNAARGRADLAWAARLARMLQVSFVGFLVGGAALSMAYYDGMLVLFALTAALAQVVRAPAPEGEAAAATPRWKRQGAAPARIEPVA